MAYYVSNKNKTPSAKLSQKLTAALSLSAGMRNQVAKYFTTASKFYTNKIEVSGNDTGATLFEMSPIKNAATTGGALGGGIHTIKTIAISNPSPQVAEISLKVDDWAHHATNDSADGSQTYIKMLIPAGGFLVLPTEKIVQYSAANSAANTYIRAFWDDGTIDEDGDHEYPGQKDVLNGKVDGGTFEGATINTENVTATAKTDANGNYNYGRLTAHSDLVSTFFGQSIDGLVPGSFAMRVCEYPFATINISKNLGRAVLSTDNSRLTANTQYSIKVSVDGATAVDIVFRTDHNNLTFAGSSGIISKINASLNTAYNDSSGNLYRKKVICSLVDGDLRFSSYYTALHHNNGGTQSSLVLSAGATGTNLYAGAGVFPNSGSSGMKTEYKPRFSPWNDSSAIMWDNGQGVLHRAKGGKGTINYATGVAQISGLPANTEMNIIAITDSALGGASTSLGAGEGTTSSNFLINIIGRSTNIYRNAELEVFVAGD